MKCFGCGAEGHLIRACPEARGETHLAPRAREGSEHSAPQAAVLEEERQAPRGGLRLEAGGGLRRLLGLETRAREAVEDARLLGRAGGGAGLLRLPGEGRWRAPGSSGGPGRRTPSPRAREGGPSRWRPPVPRAQAMIVNEHADLTLDELHVALMSLANGKAPGIDGIPVEFYKAFWPVVGEDMLEVFQESFQNGFLPQSCRRAVITLLPKKGDLQDLKNWRPVSLLCWGLQGPVEGSRRLRLREVMAEVVHVDQTYCVPGRLISDNIHLIRHVLDVSGSLGIGTGLISIDQEKAFDRVEHQYLWKTLAAFGFSPGFIARIQVLYRDVASILKINGGLAAPFFVQRGVRQGCSLSGMLYSLAIEPLLHKLRKELLGVCFPGCPAAVKLSAYADDVLVVLNTQTDIKVLEENVELFNKLSSSKVNWNKSEAFVTMKDSLNGLVLPGGLSWKMGGLKYLGVFLGNELCLKEKLGGGFRVH
ncbi:hypothetical protein L3Q82_000115 [Scortum barcoo]|uniref:Uncharacterized protein n=1 Tax=Scortum barcoo TaxID=214431 RepID=A0ACB8XA46_9TELE|nr:hypothetical protein L3Q82_000115 [Scortum barcoo]